MKQNLANAGNRTGRLFNRLAREKTKTILALCLIALMAFMWVRLLGKKAPNAAEAALMAEQATSASAEANSQLKISFIELPQVPGRNDVVTRDFFDSHGWRGFITGKNLADGQEVGDTQQSLSLRTRLMRAGLKLEAIELGANPRAFIDGKLLSVGDKLYLKEGGNTYECEVVRIEKNVVFISCQEVEVQLKLGPVIIEETEK